MRVIFKKHELMEWVLLSLIFEFIIFIGSLILSLYHSYHYNHVLDAFFIQVAITALIVLSIEYGLIGIYLLLDFLFEI